MRVLAGFSLLLALAVPATAWPADPLAPAPASHPLRLAMAQTVTARPAGGAKVPEGRIPNGTPTADPATLCETAVTTAEYVNRLPPRLLGAISLTETGRIDPHSGHVRPWPWTINAEGAGQFFDTMQQAIAAVQALQQRGVRSIDVGCLQVNLMYHPDQGNRIWNCVRLIRVLARRGGDGFYPDG